MVRLLTGERSWSGPEAARIADCAFTTLDVWDRDHVVRPSVLARGVGTRRRYTLRDLVALIAVVRLRRAGASRRSMRAVARFVQEQLRLGDAADALALRNVVIISDGAKAMQFKIGAPAPMSILGVPSFCGIALRPVVTQVLSRIGRRRAQA